MHLNLWVVFFSSMLGGIVGSHLMQRYLRRKAARKTAELAMRLAAAKNQPPEAQP